MMNEAVIASVHPKFCELIAERKKLWELRKTYPKGLDQFKCYVYCTRERGNSGSATRFYESDDGAFFSNGKTFGAFLTGTVIGEFVCNRIETAVTYGGSGPILNESIIETSCLSKDEVLKYSGGKTVYAWGISELVMYDKPKFLRDFTAYRKSGAWFIKEPLKRPPQSWFYVNEIGETA